MGNVNDSIKGLSCTKVACCSDKANEVDNIDNSQVNERHMKGFNPNYDPFDNIQCDNYNLDLSISDGINSKDIKSKMGINHIKKFSYFSDPKNGDKYEESKAPGLIIPEDSIPILVNSKVEKLSKQLGKFNKEQKDLNYFSRNLLKYTIKYSDNSIYSGEFNTAWEREGFGVFYYANGSTYEGFFNEDKFNGRGRLIKIDSSYYEGNFVNGKANGFGTYHSLDGRIYIGSFADEMMDGNGEEVSPRGSRYEGNYVQNQKKGKGTLFLQDGSKYEGEFDNNMLNGFGVFKWRDGRIYQGQWVNDRMEGFGYFQWTGSKAYIGYYENDKKNGFGIFIWPKKRIYEGFWKDGIQNGFGRIIRLQSNKEDKENEIVYGKYENGLKIKKLTISTDINRIKTKINEEKEKLIELTQDYCLKIKDFYY